MWLCAACRSFVLFERRHILKEGWTIMGNIGVSKTDVLCLRSCLGGWMPWYKTFKVIAVVVPMIPSFAYVRLFTRSFLESIIHVLCLG